MGKDNTIDREGYELCLAFDAKHFGKTKQLEAYNSTVASLAAQPFMQQKFIDECIAAYKNPTPEEVAAFLCKKQGAQHES